MRILIYLGFTIAFAILYAGKIKKAKKVLEKDPSEENRKELKKQKVLAGLFISAGGIFILIATGLPFYLFDMF
jgi:hypothetical protein